MKMLDVEPEPETPSTELVLAERGSSLEARAQALVITNAASYAAAGTFLEDVDAAITEIEQFFAADIERAHAAWKGLTQKRAFYTKPLTRAREVVAVRYAIFEREERTRAEAKRREEEQRLLQEEQARLREEAAAREAEARQLTEAAERADSHAEGAALQEQADAALIEARELKVDAATLQAPVLPLQRELPATGPAVRANWVFEVTDKLALVRAVAAGVVSPEAVEPNETYLRKRAQADKATCTIPGVRVWDAGTVMKRRTTARR